MAWIIDIELVDLSEAAAPDAIEAIFDVIYPGETWVRSRVLVSPLAMAALSAGGSAGEGAGERAVVSAARDALATVLEQASGPLSVELRLTEGAVEVLRSGRVDPR